MNIEQLKNENEALKSALALIVNYQEHAPRQHPNILVPSEAIKFMVGTAKLALEKQGKAA